MMRQIVIRQLKDEHLPLPIVSSGGEARALLWPGMGSTQRSLHYIRLGPGQESVPLVHSTSEAVYFVMAGRGEVLDLDETKRFVLAERNTFFITPGTHYQIRALSDLVVVGGPCPPDLALYEQR